MNTSFTRPNGSNVGMVNTDLVGLQAYKKTRDQFAKIQDFEIQLNSIREDISVIKNLIHNLIRQ
jgi:hypothetical protein